MISAVPILPQTQDEDDPFEGTMKLFKEEREGDVVYNIYLKKVRYKSSNPNAIQDEEDMSYLQWQMQKIKVIKAGTVEKLVEYLPAAVAMLDSSYINVFFSTYQSFASTKQVLEMLLDRYISLRDQESTGNTKEDKNRVKLQRNIRSVLMMWLDENLDDFKEPPKYPCLQCLLEFAEEKIFDKELSHRVNLKIKQFQDEEMRKLTNKGPHRLYQHDDEVDTVSTTNNYADLSCVNSQQLAEQLTIRDADLFRKVNPQHCLGSIWSRRDKKNKSCNVSSVKATINQFNSVCNCVMTTVLADTDMKPGIRAKIISKWIETAQCCREMKNFSSSKAIISGLQAQPVYRLKKSWAVVPKSTMLIFDDLAQIFMDDNNFEVSREILNKEGTAKFAYIESPRVIRKPSMPSVQSLLVRRISSDKIALARRDSGRMHGTVPYLGTFLTDLIKIDAAHPDNTSDNLVNFEKRRKEFEVIAQIKLLQNSAKNYQFDTDQAFKEWFHDINIMEYKECCEVSEIIEPPPVAAPPTPTGSDDKSTRPKTLRRWLSYSPDDFRTKLSNGSPGSIKRGHTTRAGSSSSSLSSNSSHESTNSHDSGNSSLHELSENQMDDNISHRSEETPESPTKKAQRMRKTSRSKSLTSQLSKSMTDLSTVGTTESVSRFQFHSSDSSRIIRISLEHDEICSVYKSILVSDRDHTPTVIRTALDKHHLENEDPTEYVLSQIIPNSPDLVIPDDANVFYGMNTSVDKARFHLRMRNSSDEPKQSLNRQRQKIFPRRTSWKSEPIEEDTYL